MKRVSLSSCCSLVLFSRSFRSFNAPCTYGLLLVTATSLSSAVDFCHSAARLCACGYPQARQPSAGLSHKLSLKCSLQRWPPSTPARGANAPHLSPGTPSRRSRSAPSCATGRCLRGAHPSAADRAASLPLPRCPFRGARMPPRSLADGLVPHGLACPARRDPGQDPNPFAYGPTGRLSLP
jgi:hypothetical protein